MHIPLVYEYLFYKYFVRLSLGNATKGFTTYGCFHPCLNTNGKKIDKKKLNISMHIFLFRKRSSSVFTDSLDDLSTRLDDLSHTGEIR